MPQLYTPKANNMLYLKVKQDTNGEIDMFIVDSDGKRREGTYIFTINKHGVMILREGIDKKDANATGIQLDSNGRIETSYREI